MPEPMTHGRSAMLRPLSFSGYCPKNSLINALIAAQNKEIQDLISIDVKSALMFISEVSGEVITDDILNNIFDNFCIGK